jgi:hypothetical protein
MVNAFWERPPDDPLFLLIRKREQPLEDVLARAKLVPGLGEPLGEAARWLVAVLDGNADVETVMRELQAWAAPPSSYIPPPEEFVGLAIALVEAHAQAGESGPPPA